MPDLVEFFVGYPYHGSWLIFQGETLYFPFDKTNFFFSLAFRRSFRSEL